MQIDFFGANCLRLKTADTSLVFDDNLKALGGRGVVTAKDIVCLTDPTLEKPASARMVFDMPGEYEVNKILITGVEVDGWQDAKITTYKVFAEGINYVVAGHIKAELSDEQLETLDAVDVLFVPVGGGESTLDAQGAVSLIKSLNPSLVIPTAYKQKGLEFTQEWADCDELIKRLALEPEYLKSGWRIKKGDLGEQLALKIFQL